MFKEKLFKDLTLSAKELGSCGRRQSSVIVTGCWGSLMQKLLLGELFYCFSNGKTSMLSAANIVDSFQFWIEL